MSIPSGTTPTFTLTFDENDLDLTEAANVYVTFETSNCSLTKTGEDLTVEAKKIMVLLSQAETLKFVDKTVDIQANWTTANGLRAASEVKSYDISRQLLRKVIA